MFAELSLLESTTNGSANCIFHIGINQRRANRHRFLGGEDEQGGGTGTRNEIAADNMFGCAERQIKDKYAINQGSSARAADNFSASRETSDRFEISQRSARTRPATTIIAPDARQRAYVNRE